MKAMRLMTIALLLLLAASGQVFAVQVSSDGNRGDANRIYTAVFNNSASTLTSGTVVIWDTATATANANRGAYITTTTSADSNLLAGVTVNGSLIDQAIGTICIYGPIEARYANGTDGATDTTGTAIGTTSVAGEFGNGSGLGCILGAVPSQPGDNNPTLIFVNPSNGE